MHAAEDLQREKPTGGKSNDERNVIILYTRDRGIIEVQCKNVQCIVRFWSFRPSNYCLESDKMKKTDIYLNKRDGD